MPLLIRAKFDTKINNFGQQNGLFKCLTLYIVEGHNFGMRWELRSHVTCRSINIIYYLKCNKCSKKETYTGRTGANIAGFKS